MADVLRIRD